MASKKKLLQAAAGAAGGAGLDVDEVFSTFLYTGNMASSRDIVTGIDAATEGGMVWIKNRTTFPSGSGYDQHWIFDTERTSRYALKTNSTDAESFLSVFKSINTDGFTVGDELNYGIHPTYGGPVDFASWTFRKAPKFFDILTYTGNGTAGRTVSHNLGSVPGMIIVKSRSNAESWYVYHRGADATAPEDYFLELEKTAARTNAAYAWNDTAPTSTEFTVGAVNDTNQNGATFVAYLFAHNDGDGEFGPNGDQDIIKCGSYTPDGSGNATINLGFEPQFLLIKCSSVGGTYRGWAMFDAMRGVPTGSNTSLIEANLSDAEKQWFPNPRFTPTGFETTSADQADTVNTGGETYIYIAIRRGPLAAPESATDVFAMDTGANSTPSFDAGFPIDASLVGRVDATDKWFFTPRLTGSNYLDTATTAAEASSPAFGRWDYQTQYYGGNLPSTYQAWMWKRAPSYFDVCCYRGTGSNRTVGHNLTVPPEMIWVKARDLAEDWNVYHSALGNQAYLKLNTTNQVVTSNTNRWNSTSPTASVFSLGTTDGVNKNSYNYIAYLFATVAGVSKVGSYTGNGTSQTIDCGFTNGARFVMIKRTDANGDFWIFDTARGIVTGNDSYLALNSNIAENAYGAGDNIDPNSTGFTINQEYLTQANVSGASYIFYAIA